MSVIGVAIGTFSKKKKKEGINIVYKREKRFDRKVFAQSGSIYRLIVRMFLRLDYNLYKYLITHYFDMMMEIFVILSIMLFKTLCFHVTIVCDYTESVVISYWKVIRCVQLYFYFYFWIEIIILSRYPIVYYLCVCMRKNILELIIQVVQSAKGEQFCEKALA